MRTLVSLRLLVTLDDGVVSLYAANAGCGCCCTIGPIFAGQATADEPLVATGEQADALLAEFSRHLSAVELQTHLLYGRLGGE